MNALLDELAWRGLIAHSTDLDALGAAMDDGPIKFYIGTDPTAPSMHVGHLVQQLLARRLQLAGHHPYLLVGGGTGLIGDPKETGERVMNPVEVVHEWVGKIRSQVEKFVTFEGDAAATMVNNYDWLSSVSILEFLRDVGKHFPVNRMLARDVVARRLEDGISYTEFSYVLLQSMDYRELYRRHGVTLQTGGSDQWGNLTAGVELIRRSDQAKVHALATPLITKADGKKFGKTETGTVWLDPELTSPYALHQYFLNIPDENVGHYLRVFTFRSREEIEELEKATVETPHLRLGQRALADDLTDLVHGPAEREAAVAAASAIFGRSELAELPASVLKAVMTELGAEAVEMPDGISIVDALVHAKVVESKSAARRAVTEGGAYLNNEKITSDELVIDSSSLLHGKYALLRRGKRTVGGIVKTG